ncbi:hypothetical protein BD560DRAFT_442211 [Blakeslea trispora]|nr:hypothetical protein BD560DRAFT_442211 [Blakeslea trispora]
MLKIMLDRLDEYEAGIAQQLNLPGLLIYEDNLHFLEHDGLQCRKSDKGGILSFPELCACFEDIQTPNYHEAGHEEQPVAPL